MPNTPRVRENSLEWFSLVALKLCSLSTLPPANCLSAFSLTPLQIRIVLFPLGISCD